MAQDLTEKRRNLARAFIVAARLMADGARQGNTVYDEAVAVGVVFVQADFDAIADLEHLTPQVLVDAGNALHNIVNTATTNGDFAKVLKALK